MRAYYVSVSWCDREIAYKCGTRDVVMATSHETARWAALELWELSPEEFDPDLVIVMDKEEADEFVRGGGRDKVDVRFLDGD